MYFSRVFNPLHPNISVLVLNTFLYTFSQMPTARFCLIIKTFFSRWLLPSVSWLDASYSQGSRVKTYSHKKTFLSVNTSADWSVSSKSYPASTDRWTDGVDTVRIFVTRIWNHTLINIYQKQKILIFSHHFCFVFFFFIVSRRLLLFTQKRRIFLHYVTLWMNVFTTNKNNDVIDKINR